MTIAYAQTVNGTIARRRGVRTPIGCYESDRFTHILRGLHEGIAVGIETVLSDDPRLTCRDGSGESPVPVLFDTDLRTPPDARLFAEHQSVILVCSSAAFERKGSSYPGGVARFLSVSDEGHGDLEEVLRRLRHGFGLLSVMVEGGSRLLASFLETRLFDLAAISVAPRFLGGYQLATGSDLETELSIEECLKMGEDLLIIASPAERRDE